MADEFESVPQQPADQPTPDEATLQAAAAAAAPNPEDETPSRGRFWGLLAGVVVVLLVILLLFLLPRCASSDDADAGNPQGKEIVSVPPLDPLHGVVSVWVKPDTTVGEILERAAINTDDSVDMGGGRYIVAVPEGSEADAVRRLKASQGVYDAGLVYGEAGSTFK